MPRMNRRNMSNRMGVLIEAMLIECRGPTRFVNTAAEVVRQLHLLLEDHDGRFNCMGRLYLTETLKFLVARYSSVRACLDICGIVLRAGHVDCSTLAFNVSSVHLYIEQLENRATEAADEQQRQQRAGSSDWPKRPAAPTPRSARRVSVDTERSWEKMADEWPPTKLHTVPPQLRPNVDIDVRLVSQRDWDPPGALDLDNLAVKLGMLEDGQQHLVTQLELMKQQHISSLAAIGELSGAVRSYMTHEGQTKTSSTSRSNSVQPRQRRRPRALPHLSIDATQREVASLPVPEPELELGIFEAGFFEQADSDADGFISKSEFAAYFHHRTGGSPKQKDWTAFQAADSNGDQQISRREFEQYIESMWATSGKRTSGLRVDTVHFEPAPDTPEPACELGLMEDLFTDFDSADADGDGFVSKAEFSAYCQKKAGAPPTEAEWRAFYSADVNGDGKISRAEFEKFKVSANEGDSVGSKKGLTLDTVHFEPAPDTPEPACELGLMEDLFTDFDSADADGDGFVSKAEFSAYCQKKAGAPPTEAEWRAFYSADVNGDGKISRAEFEKFKVSANEGDSVGSKKGLTLDTVHFEPAPDTPEPACELGLMEDLFTDFDSADADGDGFVSKAEFSAYCQKKAGAPPTEAEWRAFYSADVNGDGKISRAEFEKFKVSANEGDSVGSKKGLTLDTVHFEPAPDTPEPACELGLMEDLFTDFDSADADGDGFVSKAEFSAYCQKKAGAPPTEAEWRAFYSADVNGDGKISRAEFEKFKVSANEGDSVGSKKGLTLDTVHFEPAPDTPEPACELGLMEDLFTDFDSADADGDGFVSKAEFSAYCQKKAGAPPTEAEWRAFYSADVNGDGKISRAEFEKFKASKPSKE